MRKLAAIAFLFACAACAACGGVEDAGDMRIGFQRHALECFIEEDAAHSALKAKMQITGVGYCELEVNEDRTVGGLCPKVPTGMARAFRLIYYVTYVTTMGPMDVQLATVTTTLDLTDETRTLVTIEFPQDRLETNFDDDGDRVMNIMEVCMGRNPLLADQ